MSLNDLKPIWNSPVGDDQRSRIFCFIKLCDQNNSSNGGNSIRLTNNWTQLGIVGTMYSWDPNMGTQSLHMFRGCDPFFRASNLHCSVVIESKPYWVFNMVSKQVLGGLLLIRLRI